MGEPGEGRFLHGLPWLWLAPLFKAVLPWEETKELEAQRGDERQCGQSCSSSSCSPSQGRSLAIPVNQLLFKRVQSWGLGARGSHQRGQGSSSMGQTPGLTRMTDVFLNIGCRYTRTQETPESCCKNLIPTAIRMGL